MTLFAPRRRVVTGLDAEGRSAVVIDGPVPATGGSTAVVWRSADLPADNSGTADMGGGFSIDLVHAPGANFLLVAYPEGTHGQMHVTDTLDYLVMLEGALVLELEAGDVTLRKGDLFVNRGVAHGWRNDGPGAAQMVSITVPAIPVGDGRTI